LPRCRPTLALFPYTTLFRSIACLGQKRLGLFRAVLVGLPGAVISEAVGRKRQRGAGAHAIQQRLLDSVHVDRVVDRLTDALVLQDRKSTRLNSSHVKSSYAV